MSDELLRQLRPQFTDARRCRIAICELKSLLELPAGTTYYFCDIHGQGDKFFHIINNKAGTLKRKIDDVLKDLTADERIRLLKICYYPQEELAWEMENCREQYNELVEGYLFSIGRMIRHVGSKTTRKEFYQQIESSLYHAAILELVTASNDDKIIRNNSLTYQKSLIAEYRQAGLQEELVCEMVRILKNLMIHKYVINGDIPDRGPDTAQILEYLMTDTRVEINWGNHDLMWMGAAAGSHELVAELIRVQLRYDNYDILEREYGIPLLPLTQFAESTYTSRPVKGFAPSVFSGNGHYSADLVAKMQKAVAVILWKLEAERSACLGVTPYLALLRTNASGTLCVTIGDVTHELLDQDFPTLDLAHPSRLTRQENAVLDTLVSSFKKSTRLQKHMSMLAERGSLYHIQDGILSFHATVPVNPDGSLRSIPVLGELFSGKALFDRLNQLYKSAFATKRPRQEILDLFYLGWKGPHSWTFGKSGMETFTRALVADKTTHTEEKSPYYVLLANPETAETLARTIMEDFERDGSPSKIEKIFNGHIPVKIEKNERAVRAGGRVICGDGGFSEAYGDIGFVLVTTSSGIYLNKLGRSVTATEILANNADILPVILWEDKFPERKQLSACNIAPEILAKISALETILGELTGKN
ncbi:MAG TPA: fructose-bisphosphatase class III [Spirochaetota bacterium]|nr:fructose-bisphosphatase class III [Spirochaetota bacterium]